MNMSDIARQRSDVFYNLIKIDETDKSLAEEIKQNCGVDIARCMECGKCSGGCTNAERFDYTPRKIIQMIKVGQENRLLHMDALWICVSCQLCVDRCPSGINTPRIMDYLREKSYKSGIKPTRENVLLFHELVLWSVKHSGRLHELISVVGYNLKSKDFFKDTELGIRMFLKGKLTFLHFKIRGFKKIRGFFNKLHGGVKK